MSSSLASLSAHCSNEITALLTNLTDLHKRLESVAAAQNSLEVDEGVGRGRPLPGSNVGRPEIDANVKENSDVKKDLQRSESREEDKSSGQL